MSWRIRIALCLFFAGTFVALLPMSKVPAGDLAPPAPTTGCDEGAACKRKVPRLLLNTRRLRLNYNISEIGPSGVSCVELWATRDGKSWVRYSNEPPPAGPLCVHVAEEGTYGFSLVVKSGLGVSSPPPKTGDAPQLWVEVDETKPSVQLTECLVGQGHDVGCLVIGWTAADDNLLGKPISISTAVSKEGPWTTITSDLENTGKYVWQMPKDLPYEFYVRVEAADRAGNVGSDHTPRPVKVDLSRPKGVIIGIETETKAEAKSEPPPPYVFSFSPGFTR